MHVHVEARVCHRAGQRLEAGAHGGGGVDPGWRAGGVGDTGQRDAVQQQTIHGIVLQPWAGGDQVLDRGIGGRIVRGGWSSHPASLSWIARDGNEKGRTVVFQFSESVPGIDRAL